MYTCIKYIHMNPVKAGIVKEEKDYKYSSYIEEQEITLNQIRKDKSLIQKFVSNLISDQYLYSKKELAQILGISLATLYRRLED